MKIFRALAIWLVLLLYLPAASHAETQPSTEAQKTSQALSPQEQAEHLLKIISLIEEIMPAPQKSLTDVDAKTFWPSVGVLAAALFTLLGTMYTNKVTLKKTKIELDHQESAAARAQCKDYCIEYLEKLDINNLQEGKYDKLRVRYLATAIVVFAPDDYSKYAISLMGFLNKNEILIGDPQRFENDPEKMAQYNSVRDQYYTMFAFTILHTKEMIAGNDLKKHLETVRKELADEGYDDFLS